MQQRARRGIAIVIEGHQSLIYFSNPPQEVVDAVGQHRQIKGGINVVRQLESDRVNGINAGVKINQRSSVEVANGAAVINMPLIAKVDSPLEGMCPSGIAHVIDQLISGKRAQIAHVILQRVGQRAAAISEAEQEWRVLGKVRIGVGKVKNEAIHPHQKFIGKDRTQVVAPANGQVARGAKRRHNGRGVREWRRASVHHISQGVLVSVSPAHENAVVLIEGVINFYGEINLLLQLRGIKTETGVIESIAGAEVVGRGS